MPHSAPTIGRSEHLERAIWSCREHSPCSPCSSNPEKERLLIHRNNQRVPCSNLDSTVYAEAILSALTYFVGAVITVCVVSACASGMSSLRSLALTTEEPKKTRVTARLPVAGPDPPGRGQFALPLSLRHRYSPLRHRSRTARSCGRLESLGREQSCLGAHFSSHIADGNPADIDKRNQCLPGKLNSIIHVHIFLNSVLTHHIQKHIIAYVESSDDTQERE